ncbi:hypothetical protein LMG33818_002629 [Halomonadaceae bacterium LMG 33818]|uniref:head completion/stabilization protein n=1 Tax=Cernens ardua TaxID=3402176 RepID=UPI003EDBAA0C
MSDSTFIAIGGSGPRAPETIIANTGFWPDIDPNDFRTVHRITDTVTNARVETALRAAMSITNRVLEAWRARFFSKNPPQTPIPQTLSDVTLYSWMPPGGLVGHYVRAVYAEAHAQILDRYRDYDATGPARREGQSRTHTDPRMDTAASYRQDANWSITEILNRPHTTVELI